MNTLNKKNVFFIAVLSLLVALAKLPDHNQRRATAMEPQRRRGSQIKGTKTTLGMSSGTKRSLQKTNKTVVLVSTGVYSGPHNSNSRTVG